MQAYSTGALPLICLGRKLIVSRRDPRQPATPLRTHSSTHSDDITSVRFGPENVLLSASTDGLISLSNYTEDDEYEAVTDVVNWGCSIAQAGWIPGNQSIWAGSDMETFGTWSGTVRLSRRSLQPTF